MIRVYDYIAFRQPDILALLCSRYPLRRPAPLVNVWVEGVPFEMWQRLMTEKPKPGRSGLLQGETKEAVNL